MAGVCVITKTQHFQTDLHSLDDLKVGDTLYLVMFGRVEVFLGDQNALLEDSLVNEFSVLLWDQHPARNANVTFQ